MRIFDIPRYSFQAIQDRKLRSGLTILMVAIGVTLITALNGLGGGFSFFIGDQFRSLNPDVLIITPTSSIPQQGGPGQSQNRPLVTLNSLTLNVIRPIDGVQEVIPTYILNGITIISGGKVLTATLWGIDTAKLIFVVPVMEFEEGGFVDPSDRTGIILGYNVAHPAGNDGPFAEVGSLVKVEFSHIEERGNVQKLVTERKSFLVKGIIKETGSQFYDNSASISLQSGNALMKKSGEFDQIFVLTNDFESNAVVEKEIRDIYGSDIGIATPRAIQETLEGFISGFNLFLFGIGSISLLVGAVGIVTTLYTAVLERTKEFGTLKALGATNLTIVFLILTESLIIGVVGGTLGIVLGVFGSQILTSTASFGITDLRPIFTALGLLSTWLLAITLSAIAGVYPAWRASRLPPIVALRRE